MKKFLSLVLALVMTMSLVTVSAGAKDYTDGDAITYAEAIDVVSAAGIVGGYADGSFNPSATLTRGAAAKIICNMILGPTTASALSADSAPYSDVPVDHTFAGYIAYCQQQGIISGYADGTFRPAGTLTGYAFMKMLLGALGYDVDVEGYVGSNWSIAVAKRALNIGLNKGLEGDFIGTKAVNREEACLYAFNTLLATMVEYENASTITVGDIVITNNAVAKEVTANTGAITQKFGPAAVNGVHTVQFAEKYFGKLTVADAYEDGIKGRIFSYDGKKVSDYASTSDILATTMGGTAYADLTTKSNAKYIGVEADSSVSYYLNGAAQTESAAITAAQGKVINKGVITYFVDTNDNGKYDRVCLVEKSVAKLTANPVVKTSGAVTTVTIAACGISAVDVDDVDYDETLVKNDYVLYYTSADSGVRHVEKADSVDGTLTAYVSGVNSKAIVDGVTYSLSALKKGGSAVNGATMNTETSFVPGCTFYLDNAGNICAYEKNPEAASLTNTLFVTKAGYDSAYQGGSLSYYADIVMMDGTTETVKVKKTAVYNGVLTAPDGTTSFVADTMAAGKLKVNAFYTYTVNDDGSYNLTQVPYETSVASTESPAAPATVKGQVSLGGRVATAETVYVYKASGKTSYTVYEGVSAAPAVTAGTVYVLSNASGYALAAVTTGSTISSTAVSDYITAFITSDVTVYYKNVNEIDYCEYNAVVDGVPTTIKGTASYANLSKGDVVLVNAKDGDKIDGVVTGSDYSALVTTLTPASGKEFAIEVTGLTVAVKSLNADGTVASTAPFLADSGVKCFVWDDDTSEAYEVALEDLEGVIDILNVKYVEKSSTNSDWSYVFVTVA